MNTCLRIRIIFSIPCTFIGRPSVPRFYVLEKTTCFVFSNPNFSANLKLKSPQPCGKKKLRKESVHAKLFVIAYADRNPKEFGEFVVVAEKPCLTTAKNMRRENLMMHRSVVACITPLVYVMPPCPSLKYPSLRKQFFHLRNGEPRELYLPGTWHVLTSISYSFL